MLVVVPNPEQMIGKMGLAVAAVTGKISDRVAGNVSGSYHSESGLQRIDCPVAVKLLKVLPEMVSVVPPLLVPAASDKIRPPVRFVSVLFETVVPSPEKLKLMPVICAAPVLIRFNVLLLIVLVGPLALLAPFASLKQRTAVAPVKVTFEKLFRLYRMVAPVGIDPRRQP